MAKERKNLSSAKLQGLMISVRRAGEAYLAARMQLTPSHGLELQGTEIAASIGSYRWKESHDRDIKRAMRSSLLCSSYSITEQVLFSCIGSSGMEGQVFPEDRGKEPPKFISLQRTFAFRIGDEWDETWEKRWENLHDLLKLRNFLQHEGGVGPNRKKPISKRIKRGEISGVKFVPMFPGGDDEVLIVVVEEIYFTNAISMLQRFATDVDSALYRA